MLLLSVRLILIEHDGLIRIAARPVQPHIAVRVRALSRFMQHLQRCLVCVKNLPLHQFTVQAFVYGLQPVLCRAQNPTRHGLPGQMHAHALKLLLLAIQGRAHDKLLRHDLCNGFGRGKAAGDDRRTLLCLDDRRILRDELALLTRIGIVPVLANANLRRDDLQRSADLLADLLHDSAAFLADALFLGKAMLHDIHRHVLWQDVFHAAAAALSFMRSDRNSLFFLFCGLILIDLRLIEQKAELFCRRALLRRCSEQLLAAQFNSLQQPLNLLIQPRVFRFEFLQCVAGTL